MPLQMDYASPTGLYLKEVYFIIDEYTCDKKNVVRAAISGYVSKDDYKNGKVPLEGSKYIVELQADYSDQAINTKRQIYAKALTLDDFKDATYIYD